MSNRIDLKNLWAQQMTAPKPDINELIKKARMVKNNILKRLLLTNVCLIVTIMFIGYIAISYKFEMATTRIGAVLIMLAIAFYVAVSNGMLKGVLKTNPEADHLTYLTQLLSVRKKQEHLQGRMLQLYFILLSAGLLLYMIEFLMRINLLWASITAIITFGWMAFNWFYISPRVIRKQQKSLNDIIIRLEDINNQNE
jgi:hypothetical protein